MAKGQFNKSAKISAAPIRPVKLRSLARLARDDPPAQMAEGGHLGLSENGPLSMESFALRKSTRREGLPMAFGKSHDRVDDWEDARKQSAGQSSSLSL
jgi:hypothetical protein